jgi:23S rRNA pseudouridine2605 synthase
VVTELGTKADLSVDTIEVNGRLLRAVLQPVYLLLNKPKGYVTTVSDPEGRPTVLDLLHGIKTRVYPVGRLDYLSEGLLLLTNDGALAQRLMHASSHVPKTYLVKVSGKPTEAQIAKLRAGMFLPPESTPLQSPKGSMQRRSHSVHTAPIQIKLARDAANPWFEITLIEGRNRQIRRMFEQVGHRVEKIKRVRYGPLTLDIPPGEFRPLTLKEVQRLKSATSSSEKKH